MIKILQKSCFREEVRFQGERRSIRQRSGDSLDGPINLQLEMLGEKYGTETTGTEYGKNPVLLLCKIRSFHSVADSHLMHMFIT